MLNILGMVLATVLSVACSVYLLWYINCINKLVNCWQDYSKSVDDLIEKHMELKKELIEDIEYKQYLITVYKRLLEEQDKNIEELQYIIDDQTSIMMEFETRIIEGEK